MHETPSSGSRRYWRDKITPFGGWPPEKQTFPVSWKPNPVGFAEIMDDLTLLVTRDLRYFRRMAPKHIPDLLQQGWLRLWEALKENSQLLATMSCRKAADFVSNRAGATTLRDYFKRYTSYHQLSRWDEENTDNYEDSITEIVIGASLKSTNGRGHALFTRSLDILIDIEAAIRKVAAWCGSDLRKLAAFYYVTTSVSQADAGRIAGLPLHAYEGRQPRCAALAHWVKQVLERLREAFASYRPREPHCHLWREQLKAGDTKPVIQLAEKYAAEPDKLLALYVLTTQVALQTVVKELGVDESALWYAMKKLRQELRFLYARRLLESA